MFTFGFIINAPGCTPEQYNGLIDADAIRVYTGGVSDMEGAVAYARELQSKGATHIDLCGDFDAEKAAQISGALSGQVIVKYAKYDEEQEKNLESIHTDQYAFIVKYESLDPAKHVVCLSFPDFTFKMVGVPSLSEGVRAVKALQAEGCEFFELCSGFNAEQTKELIEKTDGKAAIGSAGV